MCLTVYLQKERKKFELSKFEVWWVSFDEKLHSDIVILSSAVSFAPSAAVCSLV